jgi:hypothetical protein
VTYIFKAQARVPEGVTADGVIAELWDIGERFGSRSVEAATKAVLAEPGRYPMLRAFGPANMEEAFEKCIRDGITYAVRMVVIHKESGPEYVEVRPVYLVPNEAGERVYEPIEVIAKSQPLQNYLIGELRGDAAAFARKLENTLAEIARIMGTP